MSWLGSYPGDWSKDQIKRFDETYNRMVKGVFSWTDFIPPTDLPGLGTTMMQLSLKALLGFGNLGRTALATGAVHDGLAQQPPNQVFEDWKGFNKLNLPGSGLSELQYFGVLLTCEKAVYGQKSNWVGKKR